MGNVYGDSGPKVNSKLARLKGSLLVWALGVLSSGDRRLSTEC